MSSFFDERFFGLIYDSIAFTLFFAALHNLRNKPGRWEMFKNAYLLSGFATYVKGFGLFLMTLSVGMLCFGFAPPFLNTGWVDLLNLGGNSDNLVVMPLKYAPSSPFEVGGLRITTYLFFISLILLLPIITNFEENYFRKGYTKGRDIALQTMKFGFAHLIVGIPIIFAFVLMIPGYAYARCYRRAYFHSLKVGYQEDEAIEHGLIDSCSMHTIFNFYVLSAIFITVVMSK